MLSGWMSKDASHNDILSTNGSKTKKTSRARARPPLIGMIWRTRLLIDNNSTSVSAPRTFGATWVNRFFFTVTDGFNLATIYTLRA